MSFCLVAAICFLVAACSSVDRVVQAPPAIEGAHFVGNAACMDCHTNILRSFPSSPHARFYKDDIRFASLTGCESCHGPASKHVESGGGRGKFIVNPGTDPTTCFQCHLDTHAEFKLPQHHPVIENRMNCTQCHDPHGHDAMKPAGGLAMSRLNQQCAQCHRDQARPFVYEHEALREGCITCHNPHGAINDKLLVQRDNNLCLKCHTQNQAPGQVQGTFFIGTVDHSLHIRRGTCWTSGCHTAVHGSNISPRLHY
ncbi:MAG: cytochrome c3 family protein [Verrucomicrobiota bacterium]|nr:cytochrome c3 family protein [Verrucomicrobiota bacterium]